MKCDQCNGIGKGPYGNTCGNCGGQGVAFGLRFCIFVDGRLWHAYPFQAQRQEELLRMHGDEGCITKSQLTVEQLAEIAARDGFETVADHEAYKAQIDFEDTRAEEDVT